jgi:hypothetical protein
MFQSSESGHTNDFKRPPPPRAPRAWEGESPHEFAAQVSNEGEQFNNSFAAIASPSSRCRVWEYSRCCLDSGLTSPSRTRVGLTSHAKIATSRICCQSPCLQRCSSRHSSNRYWYRLCFLPGRNTARLIWSPSSFVFGFSDLPTVGLTSAWRGSRELCRVAARATARRLPALDRGQAFLVSPHNRDDRRSQRFR